MLLSEFFARVIGVFYFLNLLSIFYELQLYVFVIFDITALLLCFDTVGLGIGI